MEPRATIVRSADGTERVILELAEFQALLDAASATTHRLPDTESLVRRLGTILDTPADDIVDLDQFLADYDALHGQG